MNNIFSKITAAFSVFMLLGAVSCIHQGDLNLDPVPDLAFSYESDGLTLTFTSDTEDASDISWTSSDGGTGTGDTFVHTFASPDTYWVQMKGDYNGEEQTVSTKVLVAKAALVSMSDGTCDDWDNVQYSDFQFTGESEGSPVICGKFDYDANYIYLYLELDNTAKDNVTNDSAIISFSCDADDDATTGCPDDGIGADYLMEGCLTTSEPCYDFYTGSTDGDWTHIDDATILDNIMVLGHEETTPENVTKFEWAYSRKTMEITSTSFKFILLIYDGDWNDADAFYYNGDSAISIAMDKQ
ncbi:MAG: hypothetical protein LKK08_06805 [Bacteroidales bacterium]|nr:hypothetical protein [Bacteroidales bacterium]MCI2145938.1 hypothetical protein [Bacteroidales bacterium]